MDAIQSLSAARFIAALSSLSSANKQPQLALELIQQSVQAVQTAGAAHSFPQPEVLPTGSPSASGNYGSVIDIYV